MKPSRIFIIKISSFALLFLLILGYGLFQARNLIAGPEISVSTPKNGDNLTSPLVIISGLATNVAFISLDDRQIFVDKHGNFSEKLLVPSGYSTIKLSAQDKFGRTTQKLLQLSYTADKNTGVEIAIATSTST